MTDNHIAEEDRMSNLPESMVSSILERLPVQDAVRTSILSKNWRYRWTTMTSLVLDEQFSRKFAKNGAFGQHGFIRIVNQVLILHPRPITKILLHIPQMHLDSFQEIDQWMLFLSRNSVRELVLTNSNLPYKLPSQLSSCSELRKLKLENCIFTPPLTFEVFPNLADLFLKDIDFRTGSCGIQVNLPHLTKLCLYYCTNIDNFKIKAQKLITLGLQTYPDAMVSFIRLLESPCLTAVGIYSLEPVEDFVGVERMNLTWLFTSFPKIPLFGINGHFLKLLSADNIPKYNSLKELWLFDLQYSDLDQLSGALCLLRSSPNLKKLSIKHTKPGAMHYDVEASSDHLESRACLDQTLKRLQSVKVECFEGSKPALQFIKLLLAHSPSLNKMTILPSGTTDASKRLNIAKDVMRFPRASPKAELIYLDPDP
ncbi:hypothetical protein OSB04_013741 [Centaurea solstitialis]|uniref:F-box domain-containing protein n=1 Tax=Centaurea solstitialis TaxID=347529 RepID=A0AA38WFS3_9ASTR|nr:hypothetical protein OSB04_013741 [Centaurea solstitialis]